MGSSLSDIANFDIESMQYIDSRETELDCNYKFFLTGSPRLITSGPPQKHHQSLLLFKLHPSGANGRCGALGFAAQNN